MDENTRNDIRKLLKNFGINADEAIQSHLARNPGGPNLKLRIVLEDLTDYGSHSPEPELVFEIEGPIRR